MILSTHITALVRSWALAPADEARILRELVDGGTLSTPSKFLATAFVDVEAFEQAARGLLAVEELQRENDAMRDRLLAHIDALTALPRPETPSSSAA